MSASQFFSFEIIIVYVGIFFAFALRNRGERLARCLADASISGIMIMILASLLIWMPDLPAAEVPKNATELATLGMMYGTFFYMMSFYLSLATGETYEINFDIKNWHLIESAALYILLVFAPPSIFEIAA